MITRLLLLFLPMLWLSCVSAKVLDKPAELRDLYYGEALYQLYQQNHFTAIVHLLAAKQQGHMAAYDEEPDLLLGGLYLAYGMPDAAQQLFDDVLTTDVAPSIHDRAWLQLAKARYRLEQPAAATAAVSHVGNTLPLEAAEERQVLEGLIDLEQGHYAAAIEALGTFSGESEWSPYGEYNRAIALMRDGQTAAGLKLLETIGTSELGSAPPRGVIDIITSFWGDPVYQDQREMKALKDRANLVRGYLLLEAGRPAEARAALEKIRAKGMDANQALLGIGWAALEDDKPSEALPPWQMLARRDASDQTVLEVMLAIPYALSSLGDDEQALQYYGEGIGRYNDELERLDQAIADIRQGLLLDALATRLDETNPDEQASAEGHRLLSLLPLLLSRNRFQNTLQDYRDVLHLESNLDDWQQKIGDYQAMLAVRQAAYEAKQPLVQAKLQGTELTDLQARRDHLKQRLDEAGSPDGPLFGLASSEEKALLQRLDRVDALIERIGEREDVSEQRKTARFLRGILVWRDVTDFPARHWRALQDLEELDLALTQMMQQQVALQQAQQATQGGFGHYASDISRLEARLDNLTAESSKLRQALIQQLQDMATATLQDRKRLISDYLVQARFGLATLLDRNSVEGGAGE